MNIIILNILAYIFMTTVLGFVLIHSSKKGGWLVFVNFLFFAWACFMVFYLIADYSQILALPMNKKLTFFETITNYLAPSAVLVIYLNLIRETNE